MTKSLGISWNLFPNQCLPNVLVAAGEQAVRADQRGGEHQDPAQGKGSKSRQHDGIMLVKVAAQFPCLPLFLKSLFPYICSLVSNNNLIQLSFPPDRTLAPVVDMSIIQHYADSNRN